MEDAIEKSGGGRRLWGLLPRPDRRSKFSSSKVESQSRKEKNGTEYLARRAQVTSALETLSLYHETMGTLCAKVCGRLLSTLEDSEFLKVSWFLLQEGAEIPLKSSSKGFYEPTVLDWGKKIIVESQTTFSPVVSKRVVTERLEVPQHVLAKSKAIRDAGGWSTVRMYTMEDRVQCELTVRHECLGDGVEDVVVEIHCVKKKKKSSEEEEEAATPSGTCILRWTTESGTLSVVLDSYNPRALEFVVKEDSVHLALESAEERNVIVLALMHFFEAHNVKDSSQFLYSIEFQGLDNYITDEEYFTETDEELEQVDTENDSPNAVEDALITSLREELKEAKDALAKESSRTMISTGKSLAQVHRLEREVESLEKKNQTAQERITSLEEQMENLQARLKESERAKMEAEQQAFELKTLALRAEECLDKTKGELEVTKSALSSRMKQVEELEKSARVREQECFRLQSSIKLKEDLRIESESRLKDLQSSYDSLLTSRNAVRAKAESLSKDIARLLHLGSVSNVSELEEMITSFEKLQGTLAQRQAEKVDLLMENAALRQKAQAQFRDLQQSALAGTPPLKLSLERGIVEDDRDSAQVATTTSSSTRTKSLDGLEEIPQRQNEAKSKIEPSLGANAQRTTKRRPSFIDQLGLSIKESFKADKKSTVAQAQAQASQLRALANSLLEAVNEKDQAIKDQRFANKKLAERIKELERDLARWQR